MDGVAGVLWGAVIALVASVLGGLLTAVVGPWLGRRAEHRARERQAATEAAAERERVLRDVIQRISEGLRLWAEAWGRSQRAARDQARHEVRDANLVLRLWTSDVERSVGMCVVDVLEADHPFDAVNRYSAWDDAALQWFRGTLPVEDFGRVYRELIAKQADWAEEQQRAAVEQRRAARNEHPGPFGINFDIGP